LPTPLAPEEECFRLLDAVSQLLIAISQRTPLVSFLRIALELTGWLRRADKLSRDQEQN